MTLVRFSAEFAQSVIDVDAMEELDVEVQASTVGDALAAATGRFGSALAGAVLLENANELAPDVKVLVDGERTDRLDQKVEGDTEIIVSPLKGSAHALENA